MNRFIRTQTALALALALGPLVSAQAADDGLALKIATSVKDRVFVRAGAIHVKVKTKSGETYDVTGPVITKAEIQALGASGAFYIRDGLIAQGIASAQATTINNGLKQAAGIPALLTTMTTAGITALGTPPGITAEAQERVNTAGISLGAYLSDDYTWVVEAYVLAAPIKTSVTAKGQGTVRNDQESLQQYLQPFGLNGQKILSTKLLPPTVMLGRYWGAKDSKFRLYTGVAAMYAMFYDTKATEALNSYVGGSNPGDTTVSLKNTFGFGPMLGFKYQFSDDWHLSLNVGSVKLKTQGTLTTRNTFITQNSGAIQDYGHQGFQYDSNGNLLQDDGGDLIPNVSDTILAGQQQLVDNNSNAAVRAAYAKVGGVTGAVSAGIAKLRGQTNLGTYVRRADTTLNTTMFMLSVGRSF